MTDQQDALRAAHDTMEKARRLEDEGHEVEAEDYWAEAERLYEDAGLDPRWLDDAELVGALDEHQKPLNLYWLFPTNMVEATYGGSDDEVSGIVVNVDDIKPVEKSV